MNLNTQQPRKESKLPRADMHPAYLIQIVGLGLHESQPFQGQIKPPARKVRFTYELVTDTHEFNGEMKPLIISEEFPLSGNEKSKCYKRVIGMKPAFNIAKDSLSTLVKLPVLVQIAHKAGTGKNAGRTFPEIVSVTQLPSMMSMVMPPAPFNDCYLYDPYDHNEEVYQKLAGFLKEKIASRIDANKTTETNTVLTPATNEVSNAIEPTPARANPETPAGSDDW